MPPQVNEIPPRKRENRGAPLTTSLFVSHKQNTSSMNLFHVSGLLTLCLKISFSIDAIKMLAKATAILVPMVVPCVVFPVKL